MGAIKIPRRDEFNLQILMKVRRVLDSSPQYDKQRPDEMLIILSFKYRDKHCLGVHTRQNIVTFKIRCNYL